MLVEKLLPISNVLLVRNDNYLWQSGLEMLAIASGLGIALACCAMAAMLIYFIRERKDSRFKWIFYLFATFLISTGIAHLAAVGKPEFPQSLPYISLKLATAIVSIITAVKLFPLIPEALKLPNPAQLQLANRKLKREIGERKIAEGALKESETCFRSIFENAAIGIALIDLEGRVVQMNPTYRQMLDYEEQEIHNKHFQEYTHPEDVAGDLEAFAQMISLQKNHYQRAKRYVNKNGDWVWVNLTVSLVRDRLGEPQYAIAMVENITERKQAEDELLKTKERLEKLVQTRTEELVQINEQLSWQSKHDPLTGLVNRYEFEKELAAVVAAKCGDNLNNGVDNVQHTLCYLNLDRFKIINETCGHIAGDELLRQVSGIFKNRCRKTDTLARLGGDEFALLLYKCPLKQAEKVAQTLLQKVEELQFYWEKRTFYVGVSIGLVPIDCHWGASAEILVAADAACYAAKQRGRSRVHIYEKDDSLLAQQRSITQWMVRIEEAIENDLFELYYQPIAPIQASAAPNWEHYEILLRLVDKQGKVISPSDFLPSAERYNLMFAIDRWVISKFFAYLAGRDKKKGLYAINLSGQSINDDRLVGFIQKQFDIYKIPPEIICFEITETIAVDNLTRAAPRIQAIRLLGCKIALDDFGSGMSSFSYLKYLPVDYLKIDGAFVKDIAEDPMDLAIVKAIDRIGHALGLKTIAEYVSDETILAKVTEIGVDYAQGYAIAKPQPLRLKADG